MRDQTDTGPSRWWIVGAVVCGLAGVAALAAAAAHQRASDRPVGEGAVLYDASRDAAQIFTGLVSQGLAAEDAVRHVRNRLSVLGVAQVDADGTVVAASSATHVGVPLGSGVLRFGLAEGTFAAAAAPLAESLLLDGVEERAGGDAVYQALHPLDEGGGLVLFHDLQELLERRHRGRGVQRITLELGSAGATLVFLAGGALVGRSRAVHRRRELALLRGHAAELDARNRELDEARRAAVKALALAGEKSRIRSEFVHMINHELRTPLTSVVTGSELLRSGVLGEDERLQLLDDLVDDARRLQKMIAQMLTVAGLENRGLDSTLRPVPMAEVVGDLTRSFTSMGVDVDDDVVVLADRNVLSQLVAGLVENAYTHGAGTVRVASASTLPFRPFLEVGSRPDPAVFLLVADDGPGIDPSFLPRAFEKFEKHGRGSGTGLGLYAARIMAEALDGSLAVTSSPRGTTIAVAVRAARVAGKAAA
jgi:signal transduction histidine kinase